VCTCHTQKQRIGTTLRYRNDEKKEIYSIANETSSNACEEAMERAMIAWIKLTTKEGGREMIAA